MSKEIERKFLVNRDNPDLKMTLIIVHSNYCMQGYLQDVRVRVMGNKGYITIKGHPEGITRAEYEYEIPVKDASEILSSMCLQGNLLIEKSRHTILYGGKTWSVDEYHGHNEGLMTAEVELEDENEQVDLPPWIGQEISENPVYSNVNLSKKPFRTWP